MKAGILAIGFGVAVITSFSASAASAQKPEAGQQMAEDEVLPPDFRGRITYSGTHEGEVTRPGPPLRSLRTRDILRSVTGGRSQQHGGRFELELSFDGPSVTGRFSGTGGLNAGSMTGTRNGSRCRLIDDRYGNVTEAECTRTRFSGGGRHQGPRETTTIRLDAFATQFVDAAVEAQRQREAMAEAERRRQLESTARASNAVTAAPAPSAPSRPLVITEAGLGISLTELMNRLVLADSQAWGFNRYVAGSMREARYETVNRARTTYTARGTYDYQGFGGRGTGWVRAQVRDGNLVCLEFHDQAGECRAMGNSLSSQFVSVLAQGMMQDMMSGNSGSRPSSGLCSGGGNTDGYTENGRTVIVRC